MRIRHFASAILTAGAFLAAAACANAETWTLELKQRESKDPQSYDPASYIYWATQGQSFFVQMAPPGSRVQFPGNKQQLADFKRIVKKEPKYESDRPFRGVIKLGSHEYAFALDAVPSKSEAKEQEAESKGQGESKEGSREAQDEGNGLQPALLRLQSQWRPHGRQSRGSGAAAVVVPWRSRGVLRADSSFRGSTSPSTPAERR